MKKAIKGFHLVRFGTAADQHFLLGRFLATYDQLVINANIVAHMPQAIAIFVAQKTNNKPFFIDPQTHAFQHDVGLLESNSDKKKGEIKRSIKSLIQQYGEPIATQILKKRTPVVPSDFSSEKKLEKFCHNVLDFQRNAVAKGTESEESKKYYDFVAKEKKALDFSPSLLVAPYFYLTPSTIKEWLAINVRCSKISGMYAKKCGIELGTQIVISRDVLTNSSLRAMILAEYRKIDAPSTFLLWVDGFSEAKASEDELLAFVDFVRKLSEIAQVVNLYGGYFSVVLRKSGLIPKLVGVSHSLEYGESRAVVPVGGGIPIAKFYFPDIHTRLEFRNAVRAVRQAGGFKSVQDYFDKICDCKECQKNIVADPTVDFGKYGKMRVIPVMRRGTQSNMEFPLPETKEKSVSHYMFCKAREYKKKIGLADTITELKKSKIKFEKALGFGEVAHCAVWADVLDKQRKG